MKPTYPAWHLLSGRVYVPAVSTDIRETLKRAREKIAPPTNVKRLDKLTEFCHSEVRHVRAHG